MPLALKPLQNLAILVACSAKKLSEFVSGLSAMGGTVFPFPVIEAKDIEDKSLLDRSIASIREYDWIVFTSAYGVRFFMQRLNECGGDASRQSLPKCCAIGPATAAELKEFGYEASLVAEHYLAEGILDSLAKYCGGIRNLAGKRILLPRALNARELLPTALAEAGAQIDVVPCYRTVQGQIAADVLLQLHRKDPDLIVFTSSSTINNLFEALGMEEGKRLLRHSAIAVMGPITANTAESYGKIPEIIPNESTVAALMEAIKHYYESENPKSI
jgi:uroporphyrinogen III methyltransferase / synthase